MTLLDPDKELQSESGAGESLIRLWFGVRAEVGQRLYLLSGLGLMLFKYSVEAGILYYYTQHWLTPWIFLNPIFSSRMELLATAPDWLAWAMFLWTLPFVWIALSMSIRRAADAGLSPWAGMLVLIPVVNLLVMCGLVLLPGSDRNTWSVPPACETSHRIERSSYGHDLLAIGNGLLLGLGMLGLSVYLFDLYGASLFLGTPLLMGALTGFIHNRPHAQSWGRTTGVVALLMLTAGGTLLLFALEGAICIAMAAPLVLPLGLIGGFIGKAIADSTRTTLSHTISLLLLLPVLTGAESFSQSRTEFVVLTTVEIDATPETVWDSVIEFPDLPPADEWFFQAGISSPLRARIEGRGVGAVRYCEFTTGTFVEPVTVWDEPARLAFDVVEQPDPMFELSPYRHVHPPHLDHHNLNSRRGEFRLIPLPHGRTRLEGRTWYTFEMFPQGYWTLWSDATIHRIHLRVLNHIKQLAEAR